MNISLDPAAPFLDKVAYGGQVALTVLAVVFAILAILYIILALLGAAFSKKKTTVKASSLPVKTAVKQSNAPAAAAQTADYALIAVLSAAVLAAREEAGCANPSGFRVVSFRRHS